MALLLFSAGTSFSAFLYEEESEQIKEAIEKSSKKEGRYPVDVAYNLQASLVKGTTNSIMVTWDVHPDYKGDVIIGRSSEIIDSRARALSATSLKVVNARDSSVYIDSELPPGSYYYTVLAKERVEKRDVELYPDINYTTFPVVVSAAKKKELGNVQKIIAKKISPEKVLISWKGTGGSNVIYSVYRGLRRIAGDDELSTAVKIASLVDAEQYIDDSIPVTGTYYYAVSVKKLDEGEHTVFIPGETYTTNGIFVYKKYSLAIQNIRAEQVNNDIQITWETVVAGIEYEVEGYALYRASIPISNYERLDFSKHLATIDGKTTTFIDRNPGPGKYYYAVLVKFKNGAVDTRLQQGYNYTADPVDLTIGSAYFGVISIDALSDQNGVKITWKHRGGRLGKTFILYRSQRVPSSALTIPASWVVARVDITGNEYRDDNPPGGRFYYGLAPELDEAKKVYEIVKGVNITSSPLSFEKRSVDRKVQAYREVEPLPLPADLDRVDVIIRNTFFRGKYHLAIKELQDIVKTSDNNVERAKARLFIGRSYIELGEYSRALISLSLPDVRNYFPEESAFWREFAMIRVK
ncbi:MAG TPA: hypothetical protein PK926_15295 [Spirochaetota bacterium]|nr:hypothetical protein [Spirochaetota bacterium]HPI91018.1 hypothetical protein [Spirochaetota bacterium]HPR48602.1 hypothetical protein [Spirochaetota bacterium]